MERGGSPSSRAGSLFWLCPSAARASLSWSPALAVDTRAAGTALDGVSCPTTDQCTAIDGHGREVTFNPQSPAGATGIAGRELGP